MKDPAGLPDFPDDASRDARTFEGWISVFECSTDFEADMVRDRLDEEGIAAVVFTQRDHSFNLNVGDLAAVHVMVQPENEAAARASVGSPDFTDAELEEAALSADLMAPDAHNYENEAMLDSGNEAISFDVPDEGIGTGEAEAAGGHDEPVRLADALRDDPPARQMPPDRPDDSARPAGY